MKKIKFTVPAPKRRNPVALSARKRKAGVHRDRRVRFMSTRNRQALWDEVWDEISEDQ